MALQRPERQGEDGAHPGVQQEPAGDAPPLEEFDAPVGDAIGGPERTAGMLSDGAAALRRHSTVDQEAPRAEAEADGRPHGGLHLGGRRVSIVDAFIDSAGDVTPSASAGEDPQARFEDLQGLLFSGLSDALGSGALEEALAAALLDDDDEGPIAGSALAGDSPAGEAFLEGLERALDSGDLEAALQELCGQS